MDMRTVWRYENEQGRGPYNSGDPVAAGELGMAHSRSASHPSWHSDGLDGLGAAWRACCPSSRALAWWFAGWHDQLRFAGFRVRYYLVPPFMVRDGASGLQCAAILSYPFGVTYGDPLSPVPPVLQEV